MKTIDTSIFYDIKDDLRKHPDCAIFIILGGRGTGKTYSTLRFLYENKKRFVFLKRTNNDIKLMCNQSITRAEKQGFSLDLSPFKSINEDIGSNVHAFKIYDGLGGFWNCDDEGQPRGEPVGYILSLNSVGKFKGFDLSDCDYIVFDEFIPLPYERANRNEGLELLDLYRTVGRANHIKNGTVLKLICLANSTTISCPVLNELELVDTLAQMKTDEISELELTERGIFIKCIPDINGFRELEAQNPIYKAMANTKWARMSLDNDFAYNDFSSVSKKSLKYSHCLYKVDFKSKTYYIYVNDNGYYMTYRKSNKYDIEYNLEKENDQKRFYYNCVIDLRQETIDNRMFFETYQMYDLIMNYKEFYKI